MTSRASVIVRCKDEEKLLGRTLESLRRQTVEPEIIVVDSGSRDGSVDIARRFCDHLIEIPAERFTYGYALNVGAEAASAPFHFALSAHCYAEPDDWIERTLEHYSGDDVGAVAGFHSLPSGDPIEGTFRQTAEHARAHPFWGFSNHASSWRAAVWREHRFNEELDYAEDREWAFRVLDAGWVIVFDPALYVDFSHVWRSGVREHFVRQQRAARAVAGFTELPPYRFRDVVSEWWNDMPDQRHAPLLYRLDYRRIAGLAGKYSGRRQAGD